ncbi:nucleotide exchange factor GrpE [Weissella paramesenteroides]|jgi:molecular chaperone GrpE|uniref:nucleotide exchange factor GrpE n=1 Tax=Weissella paramesenteroides TaxID=1249 RepID=UPI00223B3961|nr:nucleotide exchange factor GrpE [Weissella paramesenteroides]MCS9984519.1 nucleotide exchange factor GrpE [Weissella paramesenteroides]MCS9998426.1 nucleotide exchange factor GrpE [Weissella paramesenteroides]MCT0258883.1 nucleotide exchange factor GrpE [Weissella paramesenteroides]
MSEEKQTPEEEIEVVSEEADVDTEAKSSEAEKPEQETEADQISDLKDKVAEAEDKYLRAEAEMQNMQSRYAKEQVQAVKFANQKLAASILPAVDNLERALQVDAEDGAAKQIKTGVEMVYKTLISALEEHDVKAVGETGEAFDPNFHQAIQSVPADDDHPADTIATVLQKGYVLADRVIRPAMVAVYN